MRSSPPNPRNTKENTAAPIKIIKTMLVTFKVSLATSPIRAKPSCPLAMAISAAPSAPTPAASVGVAAPIKIEPNTVRIKATGGSRPFNKALNGGGSRSVAAGARSGCLIATKPMYNKYNTTNNKPGTNAPINKSPTDKVFGLNTPRSSCACW